MLGGGLSMGIDAGRVVTGIDAGRLVASIDAGVAPNSTAVTVELGGEKSSPLHPI